MINLINRIAGLAGLAMLTGAAAFAQSEMKLDVPFTFHTPNATMAPGTYTVTRVLQPVGLPVYRVRNLDTKKTILVIAPNQVNRAGDDKNFEAKVDFRCAGEYCALATIYSPNRPAGDALPVMLKNAPRGEKVAAVTIPARF
jgi:hypothetical protein